ncbi:nuclear transport factor 2 family protein [Microvirga sp. 2TAF3]|uniref:nuclear transport factor 2 family protein n=1 Tax=Microvirga sp. 2TAF3 TaxID=3233014 RepID=UPI003F9E180D
MVDEEIASLLRRKATLLVERSSSELTRIIAPGFVYINARGQRFDREGYVTAFCGPDGIRFHSQHFDDLQVKDFGSFAVATMNVHDALEYRGQVHSGILRSLCVFGRDGHGWLWSAGQTMVVGD